MTPEQRAALVRDFRLEIKRDAFEEFQRQSIRRDSRNRAMVTAARRNIADERANPDLAESYSTTRDRAVLAAGRLPGAPGKAARFRRIQRRKHF